MERAYQEYAGTFSAWSDMDGGSVRGCGVAVGALASRRLARRASRRRGYEGMLGVLPGRGRDTAAPETTAARPGETPNIFGKPGGETPALRKPPLPDQAPPGNFAPALQLPRERSRTYRAGEPDTQRRQRRRGRRRGAVGDSRGRQAGVGDAAEAGG